jgi:hypothetical protein
MCCFLAFSAFFCRSTSSARFTQTGAIYPRPLFSETADQLVCQVLRRYPRKWAADRMQRDIEAGKSLGCTTLYNARCVPHAAIQTPSELSAGFDAESGVLPFQ